LPDKWLYFQTWYPILILTDTNLNSQSYTFRLTITNDPPFFTAKRPKGLTMRLGDEVTHKLSKFEDNEHNPITVNHPGGLPSWITFIPEQNAYVLKPTDPTCELGTFFVRG
jgi:hypothetical protein